MRRGRKGKQGEADAQRKAEKRTGEREIKREKVERALFLDTAKPLGLGFELFELLFLFFTKLKLLYNIISQ